jgi:nicotinamidase-related amidase
MSEETSQQKNKTVHILITQCLQNGFFLSDSNRLALPEEEVSRMLIGAYEEELENEENRVMDLARKAPVFRRFVPKKENNRRSYKRTDLKNGPLYQFLKTVIDKPARNAELHVIHIKDWHTLSERYDEERRLYGGHCEANTWEAEPIEAYEEFLKPWGNNKASYDEARSLNGYKRPAEPPKKSLVSFYEVLSDSVFDFKNSRTIQHEKSLQEQFDMPNCPPSISHLSLLLDKLISNKGKGDNIQVYMTVIGVYTDIKIKTLLVGLRSRYDLDNLIVSDVLTASPSLDRQLEALDFIDKVLNIEIVSDLNTIVGVLDVEQRNQIGKTSEEKPIPQKLTANSIQWRYYRNYFLDKQSVLGYQDQQLAKYLKLTTKRSSDIYNQIYNANVFLTWVGRIALLILLIMVLLDAAGIRDISIETLAVAGFGSLAQIIPLLMTKPQESMQKNLTILVRLRNYLETYSMSSAIIRHHLTTPERLKEKDVENLKEQIALISQAAASLRENFKDLSYQPEGSDESTRTG